MRNMCYRIKKIRKFNTVKTIKEGRRVICNSGFIVAVIFAIVLSFIITIVTITISCSMIPIDLWFFVGNAIIVNIIFFTIFLTV